MFVYVYVTQEPRVIGASSQYDRFMCGLRGTNLGGRAKNSENSAKCLVRALIMAAAVRAYGKGWGRDNRHSDDFVADITLTRRIVAR
jgi:hypothetical protein